MLKHTFSLVTSPMHVSLSRDPVVCGVVQREPMEPRAKKDAAELTITNGKKWVSRANIKGDAEAKASDGRRNERNPKQTPAPKHPVA